MHIKVSCSCNTRRAVHARFACPPRRPLAAQQSLSLMVIPVRFPSMRVLHSTCAAVSGPDAACRIVKLGKLTEEASAKQFPRMWWQLSDFVCLCMAVCVLRSLSHRVIWLFLSCVAFPTLCTVAKCCRVGESQISKVDADVQLRNSGPFRSMVWEP